MRVIAGELKGRKLFFVQNRNVRPMTQKVKEAVFGILQDRIAGVEMLDLFCGSGGVGIEALSRGAARVDFLDLDVRTVARNVEALGIADRAGIHRRDALRGLRWLAAQGRSYGFIFVGAPYGYPEVAGVLRGIDETGLLGPGGVLMNEHRRGAAFPSAFPSFHESRQYQYGQTAITLYEAVLDEPSGEEPSGV